MQQYVTQSEFEREKNAKNKPMRHRPNRWTRLKKQMKQTRADLDAVINLKDCAYKYISRRGLWAAFLEWSKQHNSPASCEPVFDYVEEQRQRIKNLEQRQHEADTINEMYKGKIATYEKSINCYLDVIAQQNQQIRDLLNADSAHTILLSKQQPHQTTTPEEELIKWLMQPGVDITTQEELSGYLDRVYDVLCQRLEKCGPMHNFSLRFQCDL